MFHVFGALAEFERDLIRVRTRAGLAAAKARGRTGGRPSVMTAEKLRAAESMRAAGEPVSAIAKAVGVSRATLYRALGTPRDYRNELRTFQRTARSLGLKGGFHALRHSAATALIGAGVPLPTVSAILGHARTSITLDTYGHALPTSSRLAVGKLAQMYHS